jgi:transposase-like protein
VVICFFTNQIITITITKAPNDLTSLGAYFMLIIKTRERKRENPSRPKQCSPFKIRVKNSYETTIMIRLFSQLCKCFKQISFKNEIASFDKYVSSVNIELLVCPICGAKHALSPFASYKRHFVTYNNNVAQDNIIIISRYICSSCKRTHALLPSVIVPYMSFSFKFTVYLIHDYLLHIYNSVEAMCEHYGIAISTFYRILKKFKEHKRIWLGLLEDKLISNLSFVQHIINSSFDELEYFIIQFFKQNGSSFFQGTS